MLQRLIPAALVALLVTGACADSDIGITTAVKSALAADDVVDAYAIDVDTDDGVVTLTGVVDTQAARQQALSVARGTAGVHDVVDRIVVDPTPASVATSGDPQPPPGGTARDAADRAADAADRATAAAVDAGIATAIKAKLAADRVAPGMAIDVDARDGVITLSGSVGSRAEADRAVRIARETNGVRSVVNRLRLPS